MPWRGVHPSAHICQKSLLLLQNGPDFSETHTHRSPDGSSQGQSQVCFFMGIFAKFLSLTYRAEKISWVIKWCDIVARNIIWPHMLYGNCIPLNGDNHGGSGSYQLIPSLSRHGWSLLITIRWLGMSIIATDHIAIILLNSNALIWWWMRPVHPRYNRLWASLSSRWILILINWCNDEKYFPLLVIWYITIICEL